MVYLFLVISLVLYFMNFYKSNSYYGITALWFLIVGETLIVQDKIHNLDLKLNDLGNTTCQQTRN